MNHHVSGMRITVTLDPDVAELLQRTMRDRQRSFKEVLNDGLRRGLAHVVPIMVDPFVVKARSLGLRAGLNPARLHDLDGDLEAETFVVAHELHGKHGKK